MAAFSSASQSLGCNVQTGSCLSGSEILANVLGADNGSLRRTRDGHVRGTYVQIYSGSQEQTPLLASVPTSIPKHLMDF